MLTNRQKALIITVLCMFAGVVGLAQVSNVHAARSTYVQQQTDRVVLKVITGCPNCEEAEQILSSHRIKFSVVNEDQNGSGYYPKLFVNGRYYGTGADAVQRYADSH